MARRRYERTGLRPEVEQLLAGARAAKAATGGATPIETLRQGDLVGAAYLNVGAPAIALERVITIETPAAPLRALVYAPVEQPQGLPVILHFHGGGYVFMLPESFAKPCKEIAIGTNAVVVSLDYRRAPEHPYPEPLDDCVAAFRWLREHAREIGGDPGRIAIAGESAGAGLVAAVTARLIAEGDRPPVALALSAPWLDVRNSSASFRALGPDDPLIDSATMAYWRDSYVANEEQWADPLVSPLFADVSSFPPTCIVVGELDPLCDDGVAFAEKLRAAGRSVELHEYEGMPHIFWTFPSLHGLTDATERTTAFLRRQLHGEG